MIDRVVERWHAWLRGELPGGLDGLLHEDVVFYSPIVYTPQRGRAVTALYLRAASQALPGDASADRPDAEVAGRSFHYTRQVLADDTAVLEFETTIDGTYVNGVDIITADAEGRITEFRVMLRPLRAVELVHRQMATMLERMRPAD
jgi:hypothetical protein